jgi:hypothetical protein
MRVGAVVLPADVTSRASVLHLFYTPPVLVRAGEPVTVPVDVVCATEAGEPCKATVAIDVDDGTGRLTRATSEAVKGLSFDVTAPVARALGSARSGSVGFRLSARSRDGKVTALPAAPGQQLRVYVTRNLPVVDVPSVPFGEVRRGETVLFLPWGSGPMRAGLSPGREAATLGPTSFGVDPQGRIHLIDALQGRVAVFKDQRLVNEVRLSLGSEALVSIGADGSRYLLDEDGGRLRLRSVAESAGPAQDLGAGIVSQLRVQKGGPFANILPLDGWVSKTGAVSSGMPLADGRFLLRVATEDSIRLGKVRSNRVEDAVELRSAVRFGGVALADAALPAGGYLLVVRTWRDGPHPADQFQVIRVAPDGSISTFAVADRSFAQAPPLARFRLGTDGSLYQMTSSPEGVRIVRFDLEEGR